MERENIKGAVKWFDNYKGFGFITSEDGEDVFVHYSAISSDGYRKLTQDEKVEFDVRIDDKGRTVAVNVRKIS